MCPFVRTEKGSKEDRVTREMSASQGERPQQKTKLASTLTSDLQPPELLKGNSRWGRPVVWCHSSRSRLTPGLWQNGSWDGRELSVRSLEHRKAVWGVRDWAMRKWPRTQVCRCLSSLQGYFSGFPQTGSTFPHGTSLSTPRNPNRTLLLVKLLSSQVRAAFSPTTTVLSQPTFPTHPLSPSQTICVPPVPGPFALHHELSFLNHFSYLAIIQ